MTLEQVAMLNMYDKLVLLGWRRRVTYVIRQVVGPLDHIATVIE